jgi:hypothetical protein
MAAALWMRQWNRQFPAERGCAGAMGRMEMKLNNQFENDAGQTTRPTFFIVGDAAVLVNPRRSVRKICPSGLKSQ